MSEVKETKKDEALKKDSSKQMSKDELLSTLGKEFPSSAQSIYVNSLDKEFIFNEVSAKDQKTLARIMAANQGRKDIIYDTQCAMINQCAADKSFDIKKLSEFDRLKIMMALYQANMFQNEVKFTCEHCGEENKYQIDFANVLHKLDDFDLDPKEHVYENRDYKYTFTTRFPRVETVSEFHKSYCQKHKGVPRKMLSADENVQNMEYINLFIKSIEIEGKTKDYHLTIDMDNYRAGDYEDILEKFSQDVLYSERGVLTFIVNNLVKPLNDQFDKHTCWKCGEVHEKGDVGSPEGFF